MAMLMMVLTVLVAGWEHILGKLFNSLPIAYTHSPPSGVCLQFADNRWHLDNQLRQLSFGCQTTCPFWLSMNVCICASCVTYFLLTKRRVCVWNSYRYFFGGVPHFGFTEKVGIFPTAKPYMVRQLQIVPIIPNGGLPLPFGKSVKKMLSQMWITLRRVL